MSNQFLVKCVKDDVGWWTEGNKYKAKVAPGGQILVGDDDNNAPSANDWSATPLEYREDGSIIYQVGGLAGDVLFEEAQK